MPARDFPYAGNEARYVGGFSSLASQPSMSEVMGPFDTTILRI